MALADILRDTAYGLRSLCRDARLTSAVLLTVGLGIGLNSAIFSVADAILLKPVPGLQKPKDLVALYRSPRQGPGSFSFFSYPTFQDWRDQNRSFAGIAAFRAFSLDAATFGHVERMNAMAISSNYFDVLRVQPFRGRFFVQDEDKIPGKSATVVLSYRIWKRLGQDVLGKTIMLNRRQFVVVGIAPSGFLGTDFADAVDAWVPITMAEELMPDYRGWLNDRNTSWLYAVGRLREGISISQAQADMDVIARRLQASYPDLDQGNVNVYPRVSLHPYTREAVIRIMFLLTGLAGLVLLVVCANTANLLLARGLVRRREIGIRLALGADRIHIVRQLLIESLLLALAGALLGLTLGNASSKFLSNSRLFHENFPLVEFRMDYSVFGFAIALSIIVGVVAAAFSLLQFSNPELVAILKDSAAQGGSYSRRTVNVLVISQLSISVVTLVVAGLLLQTYRNYASVDPHFHVADVFVASVNLDLEQYSSSRSRTFYDQLLSRVGSLPGVVSACVASQPPLGPWSAQTNVDFKTRDPNAGGSSSSIDYNAVSSEYFRTLDVIVIKGRSFTDEDGPASPPVVMINETMANRYWPGEDPLSKFIQTPRLHTGERKIQIIGIVRDSKYYDLAEEARPMMYFPLDQEYSGDLSLLIRTAPHSPLTASSVWEAARPLDPAVPITGFESLGRHVQRSFALQKTIAILVSSFSLLVAILAALGLYSLLSYAVSQRIREIGVRLAVGAQTSDVLKLVFGQGLRLVSIGLLCGLLFGQVVARLLRNMLYGTGPTDPFVVLIVSIAMVGVGLLASYIPARQAASVDPLISLRQQ